MHKFSEEALESGIYCKKCKNLLPEDAFKVNKKTGKLIKPCKTCRNKYFIKYRKKNWAKFREKHRLAMQRYRKAHPEKAKEQNRKDRERYKERRLAHMIEELKTVKDEIVPF